jgi:hypothetical protein
MTNTSKPMLNELMADLSKHSGLEDRRYLGMSSIGQCPRVQYNRMVGNRPPPSLAEHLLCYRGYLIEGDVKKRLERIGVFKPGSERELVSDFDTRFIGHTDGEVYAHELLEIKSMNEQRFDEVLRTMRVPQYVYAQAQLYMHYGPYHVAQVVCVNVQTFAHCVVTIQYNLKQANALIVTAKQILSAVDAKAPPTCTCGRCK